MSTPVVVEPEINHQDRVLAATMHGFAIPFPLVAPLVGIAVSGNNEFLRKHSVMRLKREVLSMVIVVTVVIINLAITIPGWIHNFQTGFKDFDWVGFLLRTAIVWVAGWLYGIWNTVEGILLAIKALNGRPASRARRS